MVERPASDCTRLIRFCVPQRRLGPSPVRVWTQTFVGAHLNQWLDQFQIPIAELVKNEMIQHISHAVETVFGEGFVELLDSLNHLTNDPAVNRQFGLWRMHAARSTDAVGLRKACGVPQLSCKVTIACNAAFIHFNVAALTFHRRHEEAQGIRAILVNQAKRVDRIAL